MSGTAAVVRCEDGTEIPFAWVYAGAEAYEWVRDTSTGRGRCRRWSAGCVSTGRPGRTARGRSAGLEPPAMFYRFQCAGPFLYARERCTSRIGWCAPS